MIGGILAVVATSLTLFFLFNQLSTHLVVEQPTNSNPKIPLQARLPVKNIGSLSLSDLRWDIHRLELTRGPNITFKNTSSVNGLGANVPSLSPNETLELPAVPMFQFDFPGSPDTCQYYITFTYRPNYLLFRGWRVTKTWHVRLEVPTNAAPQWFIKQEAEVPKEES
jgi:hypothetical protein